MKLNSIVEIDGIAIGSRNRTFVIAEAGVNHFGKLHIAKKLIDLACIAQADAVKFQIYRTENLISSGAPDWHERLKAKELPYEAFSELKDYCDQAGIVFLATAHDEESFDFLCSLDPPAYKIGSGEIENHGYIEKVAARMKPVIISTGMYDMNEVSEVVKIFHNVGNPDLVLLHCVTLYPAQPQEVNLRAMDTMKEQFGCPVGYSDHTLGHDIVLASVARGAHAVEKHITFSLKTLGSQDSLVSCEGSELVDMVSSIRRIEAALGTGEKKPNARENESLAWARKSAVVKKRIAKGETITMDMLEFKRPGGGISPTRVSVIIGRKAARDIGAGELLYPGDIA